jgi:hypothetical protein
MSGKGIAGLVPEGYMTRQQLAKKIGRTLTVVKRMEDSGVIAPTSQMSAGELVVKLYHKDQLPTIRAIVRKRKAGRPRKTVKKSVVGGRS